MRSTRNILCLFVFTVLFSASLFCQDHESLSSQIQTIKENSLLRIGPFYIQPRLQFSDVGYDNNVYFRRIEDDPVADYTAAFSPEINVHLLLGRFLVFSLTENPEYHHYLYERERRSLTNSYSTGLKIFLLRRFALSGNYSHSRRWTRITSEFFAPTFVTQSGWSGSLFYESSLRAAIGISGRTGWFRYEDLYYGRELDRKEQEGSVEFYYRVFSESRFFVSVGYGDYLFENVGSQWRDARSIRILGGLRFPLLGRIRGTLAWGYRHFRLTAEDDETQSGMVSETSLTYSKGRFNLNLDYSRGIDFSFYLSNAFFLADNLRSGISYYLSRSLRFDYDFRYAENNYPKSEFISLPDGRSEEIKRRDIFRTHSLSLVFRTGQSTGLGISLNWIFHASNHILFGDRKRVAVGGFFTYDF